MSLSLIIKGSLRLLVLYNRQKSQYPWLMRLRFPPAAYPDLFHDLPMRLCEKFVETSLEYLWFIQASIVLLWSWCCVQTVQVPGAGKENLTMEVRT